MTDDGDDRPKDLDAERAVLGACMSSVEALEVVARTLTPEDFYWPAHTSVFETLLAEWETGHPTDPVAVGAALEQRGMLQRVGGAPFLHTLYASVPGSSLSAGYWADLVAEKAARARLVDAAIRVRQIAAKDTNTETADVLERAREIIEAATAPRGTDDSAGAWVGDFIHEHIASWDRPDLDGVPVPYLDLAELIGTLRPGQMCIVAGRPGSGKTVVGADWAVHAAEQGSSVMMASLEMPREGMLDRMIAARAQVRIDDITKRNLSAEDRLLVDEAAVDIEKLPLRIVDKYSTSLSRVREEARQQARSEAGCDLLIVDYIQLLEGHASQSEREQISAHSRGLKLLSAELGIPVIVLAQLNRGPEARQDKTPFLSELKGSGSLEQDADMVLLVHRPDYYERENPRAGEADLILAKHRNGPTATITVAHQLHFSRFRDLARGPRH